jgi:hypothetical protein
MAVTKSNTQSESADVSAMFSIDVLFFDCEWLFAASRTSWLFGTGALGGALPGLNESSAKGEKGLVMITICNMIMPAFWFASILSYDIGIVLACLTNHAVKYCELLYK